MKDGQLRAWSVDQRFELHPIAWIHEVQKIHPLLDQSTPRLQPYAGIFILLHQRRTILVQCTQSLGDFIVAAKWTERVWRHDPTHIAIWKLTRPGPPDLKEIANDIALTLEACEPPLVSPT